MDRPGIVTLIDEALERFAVRERVSGGEVVDFLLDLRSAVVSAEALRPLLEEEAQPTGGASRAGAVADGRPLEARARPRSRTGRPRHHDPPRDRRRVAQRAGPSR